MSTSSMPAATARSRPRSFITRPAKLTPSTRGTSAITASASANCGTALGCTKLVTSTRVAPADTARFTNSTLSPVDTIASSFCSPSRGETSRICIAPCLPEVVDRRLLVDDLGIFRLQVEQVRLVRFRPTVTHRVADHERDEPVLQRIDRARPDAPAGADPDDHHRVRAHRVERCHQWCAEERARILLDQYQLVIGGCHLRHQVGKFSTPG